MEETEGPSEFYDTDTVRKFALSEEAVAEKTEIVEKNENEMTEQQKVKLLENAVRNWDIFYKHNKDHFFKDRAWLAKEIPEIAAVCSAAAAAAAAAAAGETAAAAAAAAAESAAAPPFLVDVGCGVGNALIPILLANPQLHAAAIDCSPRAISILRMLQQMLLQTVQQMLLLQQQLRIRPISLNAAQKHTHAGLLLQQLQQMQQQQNQQQQQQQQQNQQQQQQQQNQQQHQQQQQQQLQQ
ncbi:YALI0E24717p, related [Eimeria mitis]|uniref:YALI0E24717p, related n=1 Tax=Eimeria mitis TaxID=44415 RepID=U6K1V6_9EIME|nr:YALI0E24717p, related [Eimeria mitis]CDJ31725.1 YALI0E24717p, related [Eimeria mitis]